MKCEICAKETNSEEIKGTLGVKFIYCCGYIQLDKASIRPNVQRIIIRLK